MDNKFDIARSLGISFQPQKERELKVDLLTPKNEPIQPKIDKYQIAKDMGIKFSSEANIPQDITNLREFAPPMDLVSTPGYSVPENAIRQTQYAAPNPEIDRKIPDIRGASEEEFQQFKPEPIGTIETIRLAVNDIWFDKPADRLAAFEEFFGDAVAGTRTDSDGNLIIKLQGPKGEREFYLDKPNLDSQSASEGIANFIHDVPNLAANALQYYAAALATGGVSTSIQATSTLGKIAKLATVAGTAGVGAGATSYITQDLPKNRPLSPDSLVNGAVTAGSEIVLPGLGVVARKLQNAPLNTKIISSGKNIYYNILDQMASLTPTRITDDVADAVKNVTNLGEYLSKKFKKTIDVKKWIYNKDLEDIVDVPKEYRQEVVTALKKLDDELEKGSLKNVELLNQFQKIMIDPKIKEKNKLSKLKNPTVEEKKRIAELTEEIISSQKGINAYKNILEIEPKGTLIGEMLDNPNSKIASAYKKLLEEDRGLLNDYIKKYGELSKETKENFLDVIKNNSPVGKTPDPDVKLYKKILQVTDPDNLAALDRNTNNKAMLVKMLRDEGMDVTMDTLPSTYAKNLRTEAERILNRKININMGENMMLPPAQRISNKIFKLDTINNPEHITYLNQFKELLNRAEQPDFKLKAYTVFDKISEDIVKGRAHIKAEKVLEKNLFASNLANKRLLTVLDESKSAADLLNKLDNNFIKIYDTLEDNNINKKMVVKFKNLLEKYNAVKNESTIKIAGMPQKIVVNIPIPGLTAFNNLINAIMPGEPTSLEKTALFNILTQSQYDMAVDSAKFLRLKKISQLDDLDRFAQEISNFITREGTQILTR